MRHWIAQHGKTNVVYFDESGFASDTHRPHGWAIRGREIFGRISGKHHSRRPRLPPPMVLANKPRRLRLHRARPALRSCRLEAGP